MNKKTKSGIMLILVVIVLAVLWNSVGFTAYNTLFASTTVSQLSLGQMSTDDQGAITAGRIAAQGGIWYGLSWVINLVCLVLVVLGAAKIVKGLKQYADEITTPKEEK